MMPCSPSSSQRAAMQHIDCCIALARGQRALAQVHLEMGPDAAQHLLQDVIATRSTSIPPKR
jgi:hypothetical protein